MSSDKNVASELDGEEATRAVAIERDISRRRAELGDTLEELQYRLTPSHIAHEAADAIKDRTRTLAHGVLDSLKDGARTKAMSFADKVRENPIPYALIGAGAAWLLMGGRSSAADRDQGPYIRDRLRGYAAQGMAGASDVGRQAVDQVSSAYQGVTGRAADAASSVGGVASRVGQQVADAGSTAVDALQQGAHGLMERGRGYGESATRVSGDLYDGARRQISSVTDEHPLVLAALGIAIGAAVGGLIPSTEREDALFGEKRDELVHKATDAGQDLLGKATEAGHGLAESAKKVAATTLDAAKENVLNELSPEQS